MSEKKKSARRFAREKAFQVLYGIEFTDSSHLGAVRDAFVEYPRPERQTKLDEKSDTFAWELVKGTWESKAELDGIIGRFSQNWKVTRIAKVDLTILRLGMFEILHRPDIPLKVAINEAVELAKEFGDEHSRNFVNGILDAAARAVDTGEIGTRPPQAKGDE
ncbi:transcription antitermination factor NusB [Desulfocurvibacter africanus]|uniref:Transcription antitermination protein NusB n=2 Tax=Desulfocurvibacter africanus TaxID=873 RepID=F3YXW2_DESAF|nr:transcription antitermination factor NusB [Desulfocurvibacter africanus]EGJ50664.1 NusB antitermination factor [Desulfocurvibacter africanus subsp. africanus str. Walvis Bay]EMG37048.1 NusB antitermination factor [Desulfocurvibacter africanus PCS]